MEKTFKDFVKALNREEIENFGFEFTGSSCGVREYRKGNVVVAYYGGDLCGVEVNEESIGECDIYGFGISHDEERMLFSLINKEE